ncbi:MAG: type IV secretion system protein [Wolbachia endosymbiont of Fragariocoptes setiger]|nr:type IV secretion system protein [Wolbachia endosymbiont of Fragariocoptes setiger]
MGEDVNHLNHYQRVVTPNVPCIMIKFLLFISFFFIFGCSNDCIQPTDLGVSKRSISLSTKQKEWMEMEILGNITELDIIPRNLNFCKDSNDADNYIDDQSKTIKLPFKLEPGDKISFSVIPNKICINDKKEERMISINNNCNENEKEYFAKILNKDACIVSKDDSSIKFCPNKYIPDNQEWLKGAEYISLDEDKKEEIRKNEIKNNHSDLSKQLWCNKFENNLFKEMDTYILNFVIKRGCNDSNYIYSESTEDIREHIKENETKNDIIEKVKRTISLQTYIPLLKVSMEGEDFLHSPQGGVITNYENEVKVDHPEEENLKFKFSSSGKGGYNIRSKRHININPEKVFYIHTGNSMPSHKPGDGDDIPVDISRIHDAEYLKDLIKNKLQKGESKIYFGIRDHGCNYNNEGAFDVRVTMKRPSIDNISVIYNFLNKSVNEAFFGSHYQLGNYSRGNSPTRTIYESFIRSDKISNIRSTIVALLVLSIILYTLYYFFGLSHSSIYEFLIMCVRIGIIVQLLQDNSWNFFYENLFSLFINAPKQLIAIANIENISKNDSVLAFLDLPLNRLLSSHSVLLIISLIFSGPLGIVSFFLLIWGIKVTFLSTFDALLVMVTSIVVIALLLSLSPIFIICLLFSYTKKMFTTWINYLGRFTMIPVIVMIFISVIGRAMDYIIYSVFNFTVCSQCVLNLNLGIFVPSWISSDANIPVCVLYMYAAEHTPNITSIIAFIILGHSMKAVIGSARIMSDTLFNTHTNHEPSPSYRKHLQAFTGWNQGQQQNKPAVPRMKMIRSQGSK